MAGMRLKKKTTSGPIFHRSGPVGVKSQQSIQTGLYSGSDMLVALQFKTQITDSMILHANCPACWQG